MRNDLRLLAIHAPASFGADRCPQLAAAISYHVLLSIFPLALVGAGIAGMFAGEETIGRALGTAMLSPLGLEGDVRRGVEQHLGQAVAGIGGVGLLGVAAMLWSVGAFMGSLRHGVESAFNTPHRRHFIRGKLMDLALAVGLGVALGGSVMTTLALAAAPDAGVVGIGQQVMDVLIPPALAFVAFAFCYRVMPSRGPARSAVLIGATVATLLFEGAKRILTFWADHGSNYDLVYGGLAAVASFMLFVYVAANIMLMGAEVTNEWQRIREGARDGARAPRPELRRLLKEILLGSD